MEKAVDIDVTQGQQTEIENDFLEYLKKTMISGMGVPSSFLSYADEMDFARSVSMMNGRFLRSIVTMQQPFGESFSDIYRKLYINEYGDNKEVQNEEQAAVDYSMIQVKFPSPAALNLTNLNDQIANTTTAVEFIVNTLRGQNSEQDSRRDDAVRVVTKKLLSNIDWEGIEKSLLDAGIDNLEKELTPKNPLPDAGAGMV